MSVILNTYILKPFTELKLVPYNTQKKIFRSFCILSSDGNRTSFQKYVLQQKGDCETAERLVCNVVNKMPLKTF